MFVFGTRRRGSGEPCKSQLQESGLANCMKIERGDSVDTSQLPVAFSVAECVIRMLLIQNLHVKY